MMQQEKLSPASISLLITLLAVLVSIPAHLSAQQTEIKYLSGTDNEHTVQWDFKCSKGNNSGVWSKIPVPSCWEMQGFGTYHYGWEEDLNENETGFYRFSFPRESSWKNKTVRLVFEGSMTDTEVKINGKPAGPIHRGSFYRFKYDVTKLLKEENLLEVKVDKISADTSVNRAERMSDFWVFGGIYRPVYLEILPTQFIDWVAIDARADGSFLAEVYTQKGSSDFSIEGQVETLDGTPVGEPFASVVRGPSGKTTLTTRIKNPLLWNPEFPNRYRVTFKLKRGSQIVHQLTEKFGFRTVEFRERDGFYVNDVKVVFKGANRHSFWPSTGRTLSKKISILDVNLMKDMNMNAVRMSHYPPDAHFLDVCDSLGLFVLDELAGWQKKYDTPVGRKLVKEMIMKDVNHPSIVIWDNGNEGGNNHELVGDYALYDPQKRKVIHPWNIFQGTDTQHYKGYDCCAGSLYHGTDVFFPTEIIHGLYDGGNGAGLNDHWQLMESNPLSAGCFLWAFADEGIVRKDKGDSIDVKGNLAPDGIVGPYREKEGSFFTIKEIWSPVQIKRTLISRFDGNFEITNKYLYTNLNQIDFKWRYVRSATPNEQSVDGRTVAEGTFKGPEVKPRQSGRLAVPLPENINDADVFYLTAIDLYGRELFTWSFALKTARQVNQAFVEAGAGKAMMREEADLLSITANDVSIGINKRTGLLQSVSNANGPISFSNGPSIANGSVEFQSIKHFAAGNDYVVEVSAKGPMKRLKYTLLSNGVLKIEYAYSHYDWNSKNEFDFLGVNFNYPESKVTGVKYLGYGPYRVWKNRMKGGTLNVWQKKYNNTITGESWDYPEFKGYYRNIHWVVIENTESNFTISTETENLFLRLFTPAKPKGAKNDNTSPPFPSGDISFLNGISPIGTKFDQADNHGPEGQKNKVGPEWITGVLYFDFRKQNDR